MTSRCPFSDCRSENFETLECIRDKAYRNKFLGYILKCLNCGAEWKEMYD